MMSPLFTFVFAAVLLSVAEPVAISTTRVFVFTPAVAQAADRTVNERPVAATVALMRSLRAQPQLAIVDSPDDADLIVEVAAVRHYVYKSDGLKDIEIVVLTVSGGTARTAIQGSASNSKDAVSQASRCLVDWIRERISS